MASSGSPKYVALNPSSSGDNTIVTGVTGYRIVVVGWNLLATGTVTATWYDGASSGNANLSGGYQFTAQAGIVCPITPATEFFQGGWMQTSAGNNLVLKLSGATEVDGQLAYVLVRET